MIQLTQALILASQSPRRRVLLKTLNLPFEVCAPAYQEISDPARSPKEEVTLFAKEKAHSLAQRFPNHLILGSDTLVALGETKLGKPQDEEEALAMLQALSGKTHQVLTAVYLLDTKRAESLEKVEVTQVTMKPFSLAEAKAYVATGEPMGKAGAYAIQEKGRALVEAWQGDFDNVVGLPLKVVESLLNSWMT